MPVKKENYLTCPVALEPLFYNELRQVVHQYGLPRLKLLRMIVKYVLTNPEILKKVIAAGDPPAN